VRVLRNLLNHEKILIFFVKIRHFMVNLMLVEMLNGRGENV